MSTLYAAILDLVSVINFKGILEVKNLVQTLTLNWTLSLPLSPVGTNESGEYSCGILLMV